MEVFKALSGKTMKILNPDAKIMTYDQLSNYKNIMDLFKDTNKVVLLYINDETDTSRSGHWTALFWDGQKINFFDPYGIMFDSAQLRGADISVIKHNNEFDPILSRLLAKSPYSVNVNDIRYQGKDTATCGRWCSLRLWNSYLSDKDFSKYVDKESDQMFGKENDISKKYINKDMFVTAVTNNFLCDSLIK